MKREQPNTESMLRFLLLQKLACEKTPYSSVHLSVLHHTHTYRTRSESNCNTIIVLSSLMRKPKLLSVNNQSASAFTIRKTKLTNFRGTQRQFSGNTRSEDDLRSRIFGAFVVKFLACLPLLGFSNIYKMVKLPIFNRF